MTRSNRVLISIFCLGFAGAAGGQPPVEPHEEFVCTSGVNHRVVRITSSDARQKGACRVDYTKDGKTRTLWTSNSNRAYCTKKALALVTKLIQGNYSCRPESAGAPEETDATTHRR